MATIQLKFNFMLSLEIVLGFLVLFMLLGLGIKLFFGSSKTESGDSSVLCPRPLPCSFPTGPKRNGRSDNTKEGSDESKKPKGKLYSLLYGMAVGGVISALVVAALVFFGFSKPKGPNPPGSGEGSGNQSNVSFDEILKGLSEKGSSGLNTDKIIKNEPPVDLNVTVSSSETGASSAESVSKFCGTPQFDFWLALENDMCNSVYLSLLSFFTRLCLFFLQNKVLFKDANQSIYLVTKFFLFDAIETYINFKPYSGFDSLWVKSAFSLFKLVRLIIFFFNFLV